MPQTQWVTIYFTYVQVMDHVRHTTRVGSDTAADQHTDDVMDELLNVEFLECDPLTRRDKETPIHVAVKYANEREVDLGEAMAKMLIDAGGDPRVKDGHGRKPAEICTPRTEQLRSILIKEEYVLNEGLKNADVSHEDDDNGGANSASDSE
jgi:hypothetical protein